MWRIGDSRKRHLDARLLEGIIEPLRVLQWVWNIFHTMHQLHRALYPRQLLLRIRPAFSKDLHGRGFVELEATRPPVGQSRGTASGDQAKNGLADAIKEKRAYAIASVSGMLLNAS